MKRAVQLLSICGRAEVASTALKVSLLVGLVLNLVNQGGDLLAGQPIEWGHTLLNFAVPYCVSSYSTALHALRSQRGNGA